MARRSTSAARPPILHTRYWGAFSAHVELDMNGMTLPLAQNIADKAHRLQDANREAAGAEVTIKAFAQTLQGRIANHLGDTGTAQYVHGESDFSKVTGNLRYIAGVLLARPVEGAEIVLGARDYALSNAVDMWNTAVAATGISQYAIKGTMAKSGPDVAKVRDSIRNGGLDVTKASWASSSTQSPSGSKLRSAGVAVMTRLSFTPPVGLEEYIARLESAQATYTKAEARLDVLANSRINNALEGLDRAAQPRSHIPSSLREGRLCQCSARL